MSFFSVQGITAGYGNRPIVENVTFDIEEGTLLGIIGANGSGKTTLLKAICGILPHKGSCTLDGTPLEQLPPKKLAGLSGYIPQRSGISIDISALDVVLMGFNPQLGLLERPDASMKEKARAALLQVGLSEHENENYLHLSEGQRQLCILARTLAADEKLLLLDEPESALDFRFRYHVLSLLRRWLREGERCGLVTLHDPMLALNHCDRLLLLSDGKVQGMLSPGSDPAERVERELSAIYGPVSLQRCTGRDGKSHLIMLREEK